MLQTRSSKIIWASFTTELLLSINYGILINAAVLISEIQVQNNCKKNKF